jgi:hypothetical protein
MTNGKQQLKKPLLLFLRVVVLLIPTLAKYLRVPTNEDDTSSFPATRF